MTNISVDWKTLDTSPVFLKKLRKSGWSKYLFFLRGYGNESGNPIGS